MKLCVVAALWCGFALIAVSSSAFPDAAFHVMQERLLAALDDVTGEGFMWNWIGLMSDDCIVCYPFVGVISPEVCLYGKQAIIDEWGKPPFVNSTAIQQDGFWLSKSSNRTAAVWQYTTSSAYVSPLSEICAVQFNGVVIYELEASNATLISKWLETPNSNRLSRTYPCHSTRAQSEAPSRRHYVQR
jgi:hypothetical protein